MSALGKWIAGIAATVISAVIIWHITSDGAPSPPPPPSEARNPAAPAILACRISGTIYDRGTNRPLPEIEVGYVRTTQDPGQWVRGVRSRLATTGADGRFSADCSSVEDDNFPLRIELSSRNWSAQLQTSEYVRKGEVREDVNIYVSDGTLRSLGDR
jgi:hypothetical protein